MVKWKPFAKQEEFITACLSGKNTVVGFGGSIRGGKTIGLLGEKIFLSKIFPGSRHAIIRETLPMIKDNIYSKFDEILPYTFVESLPTAYNHNTLTFKNKSQILFMPESYNSNLSYLETFKGMEVDSIGIDEISGIAKETYKKCLERLGTWRMKERQDKIARGLTVCPAVLSFSCNPTWNWIKEDIYDKFVSGTLPDWIKYIPSSVYDNPYVDDSWIQEKKLSMTPTDFEIFMQGNWEINLNEQPWMYEFKAETHVRTGTKLDKAYPVWLSFDFNVKPCTVIACQHRADGFWVHALHQANRGTRALLDIITPMYFNWPGGVFVCGDRSGNDPRSNSVVTDYDMIQDAFRLSTNQMIHTRTANATHKYSRSICNLFLYLCPVYIDANCKELVSDIMKAKPTVGGDLFKDRAKGHSMDALDAFRYWPAALFPGGAEEIRNVSKLYINKK